jgi:hypothetical protein
MTYGTATGPGGEDGVAGSKNIDKSTVVGERGTGVSRGGSTDSASVGGGRRRVVGSVGVAVTGSNGEEDTSSDGVGGRAVDGGGVGGTERHVAEDTVGAALAGGVLGDKVDTSDDAGEGARAGGVQDLDGEEPGVLGDTVGGAANGTSNVSAVAVAVGVGGVDDVASPRGTAAEVLLPCQPGIVFEVHWGRLTEWVVSIPVSTMYEQVPVPAELS